MPTRLMAVARVCVFGATACAYAYVGAAYVVAVLTEDCNENEAPDACDIADGTSDVSNGNGISDECE